MSLRAERVDMWRWIGVPVLICLAATLLFAAPIRVFGLQLPEPIFPLAPAFAWGVLRPSVTAPFALLAMGLFLDMVWGSPTGLWSIALIAAYVTVIVSRAMMTGQSRTMMWVWYAAACAVAMSIAYCATTVDSGVAPNLVSTFWQWLPTMLLYPFAHRLIERFEDADTRFR
jgi:rod shape-determining protein MreD